MKAPSALRLVGAAAAGIVGIGWTFSATNPVMAAAGALLFGLAIACFLVRGLLANYWLEGTGIAGALLIFMGPRTVVLGGILLAPAIMVAVGRIWSGIQDEVMKASKERT